MADLYKLINNVYTTSEGMSEALEDKYPTFEFFERDVAELSSRPGAIVLIVIRNKESLAYLIIKPRQQANYITPLI